MWSGSMVALVTPFRGGQVDRERLGRLVEWQIEEGTSALVPCGTTGESATLSHEEHERVIELVIEAARGRCPVIAGTGSNNTAEAIRLTQHAEHAGATGALLIAPYYNRPSQEGLFQHFRAIAQATALPLMLYNIPSRTGVNVEPETVARLVEAHDNIVAIKEASGNLEQMARLIHLCGERLALISGDDALTLPILAIGGRGVVSVAANVVPADVARLVAAFLGGQVAEAQRLHDRLLPVIKALFITTNPSPVKAALGLLGLAEPDVRLPLVSLTPAQLTALREALTAYGLLRGTVAGHRSPA